MYSYTPDPSPLTTSCMNLELQERCISSAIVSKALPGFEKDAGLNLVMYLSHLISFRFLQISSSLNITSESPAIMSSDTSPEFLDFMFVSSLSKSTRRCFTLSNILL
ncbi:hypothetical protein ACFX11_019615 [Malus domestica]